VKPLTGVVKSGRGVASAGFSHAFEEITRRTGIALASGTLNVQVLHEYALTPEGIIPAELGNGVEAVQYAACRITSRKTKETVEALIVRTSTQAERRSVHRLDILEIAAPISLRDALRLTDGSPVIIHCNDRGVLHQLPARDRR
jgi:CTP-dependent riboflavin kinase